MSRERVDNLIKFMKRERRVPKATESRSLYNFMRRDIHKNKLSEIEAKVEELRASLLIEALEEGHWKERGALGESIRKDGVWDWKYERTLKLLKEGQPLGEMGPWYHNQKLIYDEGRFFDYRIERFLELHNLLGLRKRRLKFFKHI